MRLLEAKVLALAAALAAAGCNQLIGAGEPEVIDDPAATGDQDPDTSGGDAGSCGDGVVGDGEECDDGNDAAGDGCSACEVECAQGLEYKDELTHHCYRFESMSAKTWEEASTTCEAWGGTLASLTTFEEFVLIQQHVTKDTWIGGIDPEGTGAFQWVTGEPWSFARWRSDAQPAADGQPACVLIAEEDLLLWVGPCETPNVFVCERAPAGVM